MIKLIPHTYKKIGWSILCLAISPLIIAPIAWGTGISFKQIFGWIPADKFNDLLCVIGIMGLFIVIMSKERDENEKIMRARYKALASAFIVFVSALFVGKLMSLFEFNNSLFNSPTGLIFFSLIFYFSTFYSLKNEEEEEN